MKDFQLFKNIHGGILKFMAILWLSFFLSTSFANLASAHYVYNIKKENKRNEKQKAHSKPYKYDKAKEDKRNEKQKPKKNDYDKSCSHGKYKTKYCPQSSPFIEKYLKDYSDVKGHSEFTDRYVKDYSNARSNSAFTDRYLQDYSGYDYNYYDYYY